MTELSKIERHQTSDSGSQIITKQQQKTKSTLLILRMELCSLFTDVFSAPGTVLAPGKFFYKRRKMNGWMKTADYQTQTLRSPKQPGRKAIILKEMTNTPAADGFAVTVEVRT